MASIASRPLNHQPSWRVDGFNPSSESVNPPTFGAPPTYPGRPAPPPAALVQARAERERVEDVRGYYEGPLL
jgi:hypothetical protein